MGKEKIEEKDVRLLRYAVEQAFDGAMRDGALALLNRLVDSASEAANLEEELLNLKGEYQRSMENSKRGAFKRLDAAYKRKCRREKRMAKGQMLCADGKPVMFGETLYGGDGRDWLLVGIAGAWSYDVYGLHVAHDGKKEKKPYVEETIKELKRRGYQTAVVTATAEDRAVRYLEMVGFKELFDEIISASMVKLVAEGEITSDEYMTKLDHFIVSRTNRVLGLNNQYQLRSCYDRAAAFYKKETKGRASKGKKE